MTESEFLAALRTKYAGDAYAVLPQVRNGTGASRGKVRTADAIVVSMWPSRGVYAHGFEFKDSRADWLKETKQSDKAHEIGRFCRYWTVLASGYKIVDKSELPPAWGLYVIDGGKFAEVVKSPCRETDPLDWPFVASVFRSAVAVVTNEAEVEERIRVAIRKADRDAYEAAKRTNESARGRYEKDLAELTKRVDEFEEAAGISIGGGWPVRDPKEVGKAVKFVLGGGIANMKDDIRRIAEQAARIKAAADTVANLEAP